MQGVYTAEASISAQAVAATLMFLTAPSDAVVELISVHVTNGNIDSNEQLEFSLTRITSLGTPTSVSVTPEGTEAGSAVAGSTVEADVTASEPTYHTVDHDHQGVSNLAGYEWFPPPEGRVFVSPSASVGLQLLNIPVSPFDAVVQFVFREIGG